MNSNDNLILEMRGIRKSFSGVVVLEDINFALKAGKLHAIVGENGAGKSTLMKILAGLYKPDRGEIFFMGEKVEHLDPKKSINMGVSMIHQELSPVPNMTIAENIFLGCEPIKHNFVNFGKMNREAKAILESLGLNLSPTLKMNVLSTAEMQMIEIAKAINREAKVIIMDEPTSSLTTQEASTLFEQIAQLKNKGIAIVYITHKMDEIFLLSDSISILRDGRFISTGSKNEYTMDRIISEMVGREISNIYPEKEAKIGRTILEVKNLTRDGYFEQISFSVRSGEIVGFSGLVGAGRTEVMRAIFGLDKYTSGEIFLEGEPIHTKHCADAIKKGVVMVSEDRKQDGLILCRSVRENMTLSNLDLIKSGIFLNIGVEKDIAKEMIEKLHVKTNSMETLAANLSGGNQQKIVLIKWLLRDIKVLILDEPTRGIDVGAKFEIYKLMCDLAKAGKAIIMISSELPEVLGMSDRVVVMNQGKVVADIQNDDLKQEDVIRYAV